MRSAIMFGVLGCSLASAQEPGSPRERFVRDSAAIVLELDGPASLRSKFLATNLGTMLAAQDAGDLWTALRAPLERALRSIGEDSGARLTGLLDVLDTYRGRITLAIELTVTPMNPGCDDEILLEVEGYFGDLCWEIEDIEL